jgi:hypothetical protein
MCSKGDGSAVRPVAAKAKNHRFSATLAAAAALALAGPALLPGSAPGLAYEPPPGSIYTAVTDTGKVEDFWNHTRRTGKHPPVIHTWNEWGTGLRGVINRWATVEARPLVTITTKTGFFGRELITPQAIAMGQGDDHLLDLNKMFGEHGIVAYIRPLAEANGWRNPYSAINSDGSPRDSAHTHAWYIKAWRRMTIILRDGGPISYVNSRLAAEGLPPVRGVKQEVPAVLYTPPIAFLWTPLVHGSPDTKANAPGKYYPGDAYVDWVGTDFYSNFPDWKDLNRFYRKWKKRGKPFAFGEWGVTGRDDPRFVKKFMRWGRKHRRVQLLAYYQDFNNSNPYHLRFYPRSAAVLRKQLRNPRYLDSAPYLPQAVPGPE